MDKLNESIENLRKNHGDFIVLRLNDKKILERPRMSTGSYGLDEALGGGFVKGSLNEIYGPEASGKTTVCIHAAAAAQKEGIVLYIDMEHAFDPVYAKNLGVDINELLVSQPDYAEQAFDIIQTLVPTGSISLVILDSIPALLPKAELEGDPGESHMGLAARLNRQHLRKIIAPASKSGATILYVNQITYKIGIPFGNPETTTGGTGFKYFCSSRIDIRKISTQKDNIAKQSIRSRVRVVKNKTAIPFKEAEFDIKFGKGIDTVGEILDAAVKKEIVEKSGAWYSYQGNRLGQGRDNTVRYLESTDHDTFNIIRNKLNEV